MPQEKTRKPEFDPAMHTSFEREIAGNKWKSLGLAATVALVLFALLWFIGWFYAPEYAGVMAFLGFFFTMAYLAVTWFWGDQIVLASTGAKPLEPDTPKGAYIHNIVEGLCIVAGIPKPKIYVIESAEMNAFATGRDPNHASIAFTTGILEKLNRNELEGVAAHELSHVANYDVRFAMIVAVMVGVIAILADVFMRSMWYGGGRSRDDNRGSGNAVILVIGIILAIFAPIIVRLVQMAISRKREFMADASGARLTRYPEGLASALEKIGKGNKGDMKVNEAVSHLFFADPSKSSLDSLYATHPPIEERIRILRAM